MRVWAHQLYLRPCTLTFTCFHPLQVPEVHVKTISLGGLVPYERQQFYGQAYCSATYKVATVLGAMPSLSAQRPRPHELNKPLAAPYNSVHLKHFGTVVGCETMMSALQPAAHHLAAVVLQASSHSRRAHKRELTGSFVATLGEVLGPHTHTLGLEGFSYSACGKRQQQVWAALLAGLPKLRVLRLSVAEADLQPQQHKSKGRKQTGHDDDDSEEQQGRETGGPHLGALSAAVRAASRALVLHLDGEAATAGEVRELAAASSGLTVVWRDVRKWLPGGKRWRARMELELQWGAGSSSEDEENESDDSASGGEGDGCVIS